MNERGITLIELTIVVAIIVILAFALGVSYVGWQGAYKVEKATKELYTDLMDVRGRTVSLQADFNFSNDMLLTSITAYRNLERFDNSDGDFTTAALLNPIAANLTDTTLETFTQEFRLSGSTEKMDWLVGAVWFDEDVEQNSGVLFDSGARPYVDAMTKLAGVPSGAYTLQDAANPAVSSPVMAKPCFW